MYLKKKILFTITLAMCFIFEAHCQFIYTKQGSSNSYFGSIYEIPATGNYLLSNTNYTVTPNVYYPRITSQLLKISATGILLDSLPLDSNFVFTAPVLPFNKYYYIVGAQLKRYPGYNMAYLTKVLQYDSAFNLVNSVILDSTYNRLQQSRKIIQKNNSLYIAVNKNYSLDSTKLYKMSLNLNILNSVVLKGFVSDFVSFNQNIIMAGHDFPQTSVFGSVQVAEIDTFFNVLNRFNLDSLTYVNVNNLCGQKLSMGWNANLQAIGNDKYFVSGISGVIYNSNCNTSVKVVSSIIKDNSKIQATNIVGTDGFDNRYDLGIVSSSKKYNKIFTISRTIRQLTSPVEPQNSTSSILVHMVDTSGNLVWQKYFGGDMYYSPIAICATVDGGAVICGMRYDTANPKVLNACEGFVMKINKEGEQVFVGIRENGRINTHFHRCFPNPSNDNLMFDLPFQENIEIRIYNSMGQEFRVIKNYQNLSALNISSFVPGTYIYKIKTKARQYSGKFVKE